MQTVTKSAQSQPAHQQQNSAQRNPPRLRTKDILHNIAQTGKTEGIQLKALDDLALLKKDKSKQGGNIISSVTNALVDFHNSNLNANNNLFGGGKVFECGVGSAPPMPVGGMPYGGMDPFMGGMIGYGDGMMPYGGYGSQLNTIGAQMPAGGLMQQAAPTC